VPIRPLFVAIAGLAAPLLAYATAGAFSRYAADDFCTAGQVQAAGFLIAQARLYSGWSGRFSATFLITLLEVVGAVVVPLLPALALAGWAGAATWTVRQVAAAFGRQLTGLAALAVALVLVFATLQTTADVAQDLFWQTGIVTYLWPLVLATVFVGWLVRYGGGRVTATGLVVSFVLALAAGGTSETFAASQVGAIGIAIAGAVLGGARPRRGALLALLGAGLLGALLALAIVALAPGNEVRQESGSRTPLAIALPQAIEFTQGWLRLTFARPHAAALLLVVGVPAGLGAASARQKSTWLVAIGLVVATLLVILACMLPAYYALGTNPPGRAQIVPEYVLMCSLVVLGWLAGTVAARWLTDWAKQRAMRWAAIAGLLVLLALGPLFTAGQVVQQIQTARDYAGKWDQLDGEVRAERERGVQDVTVRPLPSTGAVQNLEFIGPNRADWFNECVARYYGVRSIGTEA
jgi:hypothetical protein